VNVIMLHRKVNEENVADVQASLEKLFQEIDQAQPAGVRYASGTLTDGVTFVALLQVENGSDNPLLALPAYGELLKNLEQWAEGPAAMEQMTLIGSYRLF
jgi:hypothetical protein